jgi:autotransporter-associated beta strand protein
LKQGLGDVTLSGDNSGLTGGLAASRIDSGNLILDFSANNAAKISQGANLRMLGGNLILLGGIVGPTTQNVLDLQLDSSGSNRISLVSGAQATNFAFGGLTRGASQGTIRFELPANGTITGIVANAAGLGILGGYATVKDAAGTWFASMNGTNLEGLASTTRPDVSTWLATDHVTDGASTFTGTSLGGSILSLRMNGAAGSNLALGHTSLAIASGGILATSNVATGSLGISGGFLSSNNNEIVITQDSPLSMSVSSWVGSANGITKTGPGTLVLSGFNTYTGQTQLQAGTLEVTGGNALGDTSLLTMADDQFTTLRLLESETIGRLQGGSATDGLRDIAVVDVGVNRLTLNTTGGSVTYSGRLVGNGQIVKQGTSNQNFNNISLGFNGSVVVNEGLFQMNGIGQIDASSFTINKGGNLLLDNNGTTRSGTRILDTTPIFLNSADGVFSGETTIRGLAIRTDQNATTSETVGNLVFSSGASYLTGQASGGTSAQASVIAANFVRENNATVSVRGRNLGGTANERNQFRIGDTTNQTNFLASSNLVGGSGALGTTTLKIVPWAIGESVTGAVAATNMGNSLVTYVSGAGFRALDFTTEYAPYATAAATDNVRESFTTDLTGLTGKTVNSLVLHNNTFASTNLNVTGAGAGQSLTSTSGAFLFTIASSTGSTVATNVGGFDSGITVGGSEYVMHVVNPSAVAGSALNVVTLNSPLTTAADLTKSGRGTLVLTTVNTAGGGANKTTINEGILEISDLDNLGGDSGGLVLAGGTLRLSATYSGDDLSLRSINLLTAGGTLDTNGNSLVLSGSLGSGVGGLTKTGLGSLTLNAAASYTGATTLAQGSIVLGADNAIGSGPLNLAGGTTLDLGVFNVSTGLVTLSGASPTLLGTGAIQSSGGFFFNHTGDAAVTAQLIGAGGLLKTQNNILTLNAANGYTGRTEVRAGTLVFDSITPLGGGASALGNPSTVLDGMITMGLTTTATTLTYTGAGHDSDRLIGLQGTTGGLTVNADGTGGVGFGGATALVPGNKSITLSGTADSTLINSLGGIVEGAATLSVFKSGAATWVLDGEGNYSGTTTVNEGILRIADDKALGSDVVGTVVNSGATLQLSGDISVVGESLSLNGAGALGQDGVLVNVSGSNSYSGDITLSTAATFVSQSGLMTLGAVSSFGDGLTVTGSGDTSLAGNLQLGAGQLTKIGTGILSLGGDNTFLGGALLSGGILEVASTGALGASGNVTFDGGVFRHGVGDTVDHSGRFVANVGATYRIATSGQTVTYTSPLSGVGSGLEKSGAGTLVIAAVNTFDGPVSVTGGRLAISDEANLGVAPAAFAAAQLLLDGGALNTTADLTLDDANRGVTLGAGGGIFDTDANTTLSLALAVEGTGLLIKDGSGTVVLNSVTAHTGGTQVQGGILRVGVNNAVSGDVLVTGSGTLDIDDKAVTVASFSVSGAGAGVVGTGSIDSAAGFSLNSTGEITLSANLTGAGALTKNGVGTAFLTANTTFTGGTSITEGALFLDGGSLATGPVTVASAASFGGIGTVNGPVSLLNGTGTNPGEQALLNVGGGVQSGLNLLTLEDSLTLGDFAIVDFYLSKTGFTKLDLNGTATFAANSRIRINLELGYIPSEGSVFDLLDWTTLNLLGGGTLLDYLLTPLPDLGGALWAWDTSTFAIDGMLKTTGLSTGPSIVTDPLGGRVLAGEPVTFTVDVAGSDPMTVQWYKGAGTANPIQGATTLSYTIPAVVVSDSGSYWARIINGINTVDTQLAVLDVVTTPRIDVEPNGAVLFPSPGTDHTFSVTAVGPGTLSYVWNKGGVPIPGAPDAPDYTINDVTIPDSGNYTVTVSNSFGSVTSAVAVLLIQESIVFDTHPQTPVPAVPEGNTAQFTASVSGDGPFTYQWEFDAVGGAPTFVSLTGETAPTLSRNVELATLGNYRVVVSNAYTSRTSDPAILAFGNPQVIIDTQPISKVVALGSTLELTVASSGGKPQRYQWFFKNKPVGDETDATLRIEDVTSARVGQYFCRITNTLVSGSTQVDSAIVTVAVVDQKPGRFVVTPPGSVSLSVTATADRSDLLTYQWFMDDGLVSAPNEQPVAGATARTLRVTNLTEGRKRFFCRVSAGGGSRSLDGGDNVVFVYTQAPQLQPEGTWNLPDTMVSQPYAFQVPMVDNPLEAGQPDPLKMPVSFRAVGLPTGLTINSAGLISGRATVERRDSAGVVIPYVVTITATNRLGTTTPIVKNLLVTPLDVGLIGAFTGPVDRNASLNGNLGGIINFTTTKTGTYSGRLTMGAKIYAFKGALNSAISDPTNPSVTVKVSRGTTLRPLLVSFRLNSTGFVTGPTSLLTRGVITDGRTVCELDGWRNTWLKTKANPTPALAYSGYYTLGLELPLLLQGNVAIPQGIGYASFTVNSATGTLSVAGRLADGTAFTTATYVGPTGEIAVFRTLYSSKTLGSVLGRLTIDDLVPSDINDNTLAGTVSWWKPAQAGRAYAAGFGPFDLTAVGSRYNAPVTGTPVMGITPPVAVGQVNAVVELLGANIESALPLATVPAANQTGFSVSTVNRAVADVLNNPRRMTATINSKTGTVTGSVTLSAGHPFGGSPAVITRKFSYFALIVNNGIVQQAWGYYLLPQLPSNAAEKVTATPILSGQAVFERFP